MEGQITKIISNLYTVTNSDGSFECHARGKFRHNSVIPMVGDYVKFDEKERYILDILPRKNALIRPFVSNIDQGLIVTSLKEPDFSSNLLDKLILIMEFNRIRPIICITKEDLLTLEEKEAMNSYIDYYKKLGYLVLNNTNIEEIKQIFKDKVTVFTGQSGSGKSTLLNMLDSSLNLDTNQISKALGRGKHTTRYVELFNLYGGKVLDTPGFSLIDLSMMKDEEIAECFIEFSNFGCKFKNCKHLNEKECAVKEAVKNNEILKSRYDNYRKFIEKK